MCSVQAIDAERLARFHELVERFDRAMEHTLALDELRRFLAEDVATELMRDE